MTKPLSTPEQLALAVLRGDSDALEPLLDSLLEERGALRVPSVRKVTVNSDRLRVVVRIAKGDDPPGAREAVERWLMGNGPLVLPDGCSLELYELPEGFEQPQAAAEEEPMREARRMMEALRRHEAREMESRRRANGREWVPGISQERWEEAFRATTTNQANE